MPKVDPKIKSRQNKIIMKLILRQWPWLILAAPWMFIGAIGEFAFPDFIGKLINSMKEGDEDEFKK